MKTITFYVHRSSSYTYETEVPEDFDTSDETALLDLADGLDPVDDETNHLSAFI
ncbi:hypothetical protein SEA_STEAMY_74 [Mycobacterium phage Steamy]|uniref:Uncharacterized protein n=1 Tax=Mycobacterium phage Steamy TaxID=2250309 RepID=A0A345L0P6_9CAUD|nr:hypothetical protein KIV62_gp27 [Mycobacterium phage Steamy]AXH48848.1 hypothetical protein SEA_STEAMY_74 [Mycobacterium phage Steamy]